MPTMLRYLANAAAIFLALLLCLHIFSLPSSAGINIMVSPTMIDLTLNTEDTSTQEISIRNTGDEPSRVQVYAMDFSIDRENNYIFSDRGASELLVCQLAWHRRVRLRSWPGRN